MDHLVVGQFHQDLHWRYYRPLSGFTSVELFELFKKSLDQASLAKLPLDYTVPSPPSPPMWVSALASLGIAASASAGIIWVLLQWLS